MNEYSMLCHILKINRRFSLSLTNYYLLFSAPNLIFQFFSVQVKMRINFESCSEIGGVLFFFFQLLCFHGVHFYRCYVFHLGNQVSIKIFNQLNNSYPQLPFSKNRYTTLLCEYVSPTFSMVKKWYHNIFYLTKSIQHDIQTCLYITFSLVYICITHYLF